MHRKSFVSGLLSGVLVDAGLDKENMAPAGASPGEVVRAVRKGLTDEEKGMTVREWVYYNAQRGEEKLRAECERLVHKFEEEAERAIGVLEAMEVCD